MSISSVFKSKDQILETLKNIQKDVDQNPTSSKGNSNSGSDFIDHLRLATKEVNQAQVIADTKAIELNTGRNGNIHETMLAATQAELSFNLLVHLIRFWLRWS